MPINYGNVYNHPLCVITKSYGSHVGFMLGVTSRQGMLTPLRYLVPPLVCQQVRACLTLFGIRVMRLIMFVIFTLLYIKKKLSYNPFII